VAAALRARSFASSAMIGSFRDYIGFMPENFDLTLDSDFAVAGACVGHFVRMRMNPRRE
jgi:hypothetical protein